MRNFNFETALKRTFLEQQELSAYHVLLDCLSVCLFVCLFVSVSVLSFYLQHLYGIFSKTFANS